MANDASEVVVAGDAKVYTAPEGTALPDDLDAPSASYTELGYVKTDGVSFDFGSESKDIEAMQAFDPIRTVITKKPKSVKFALQQSGAAQTELALGGGEWVESITEPGTFEFVKPADSDVDERVVIVDLIDGDETWRYIFPRGLNKAGVKFAGKRDEEIAYEIEMSILTPTDGSRSYRIRTNSPSVEVAS